MRYVSFLMQINGRVDKKASVADEEPYLSICLVIYLSVFNKLYVRRIHDGSDFPVNFRMKSVTPVPI